MAEMVYSDQIVAIAPRKLNISRVSEACGYNNHKSLSGIETRSQQEDGETLNRYNNHKSLSGIETNFALVLKMGLIQVIITINPYQGLKLALLAVDVAGVTISGYNNHKSLSGIETLHLIGIGGSGKGYNNHKSLSGIETVVLEV